MPRATWKGAISFGLIHIPVSLYGATETKDVSLHQVHIEDGGRIRYRRVCEKCGEEVPYGDIGRGYEAPDGRTAILTKEDLDELPLASSKTVEIVTFIDAAEIDPVYFEKSYLIEAAEVGAKPYVLLRDALTKSGKVGVVKVALRTRESLAVVRPRGDLLVMETMLWPDEVRDSGFAAPDADVKASDAEVGMAEMFIEQMSGEWHPEEYTDGYRRALEELVASKLSGEPLVTVTEGEAAGGEVVDLMAALRASVEAAKKRRAEEAEAAKVDKPAPKSKRKAS